MIRTIRWAAPALLLVAAMCNSAEAGLFSRFVNQEEIAPPVLVQPAGPVFGQPTGPMFGQPDPAVVVATPVSANLNGGCTTCCPAPCIAYRHAGLRKVKCCGCEPPISTVLCVKNPCTCCPVEVPVCLPNCCTGAPTVSCRGGLLCDGIVTYDWCCGVSVSVRFKHCGDVLVTYRGA